MLEQVGAAVPCGLWQSVQFMKPSFTRCLNGMENCARTFRWQPSHKLVCVFASSFCGVAALCMEWQLVQTTSFKVCEERRMLARESVWLWHFKHASSTCSLGILVKETMLPAAPKLSM